VSAEQLGDYVRVVVTDSGPGLSAGDCKRVFSEFFKVPGPGAAATSGSGLGLTIAKKLVMMHGGEIWAESEEGHGASFIFTLPRRP
jgi:two-component system sensor histidine kinase VicK